jgi:hypothetical protein
MDAERASSAKTSPNDQGASRDRLELIRFPSADVQRQAIRVLLDRGMLNFTSYREEEWYVRTPVARVLRERGVPFEWLSEHA